MLNSRVKPAVVAGLLAMVVIHAALFWALRQQVWEGYSDLASFYGAGRILRSGLGHKLYDFQTQWDVQRSFSPGVTIRHSPLSYNHAPFEAWIFAALAGFSYDTAYVIWATVNLAMLAIIAGLLRKYLPGGHGLAFTFLVLLAFFPVFVALLQGQDSILLLLIYVLAFQNFKSGRNFLAGVFLGLGLFKVHLVLPLLTILVLQKHLRILAGFTVSAIALFLVSLGTVGWNNVIHYPQYVWRLNQHHDLGAITPRLMPNLRGLLEGFMDGRIPRPYVTALVMGISIALVLLVAAAWRRTGSRPSISPSSKDLGFSLAVLTVVLVSYHLYVYDATLLVLPAILVAKTIFDAKNMSTRARFTVLLLATLWFSPLWTVLLFRIGYLNLMCLLFLFFGWTILRTMSAAATNREQARPSAAVVL